MNELKPSALEEVIREVLDSIDELGPSAALVGDGLPITSWIRVSRPGCAWIITMECAEALLRGAAATVFSISAEDVTVEQMRETLAEMVNMVGGNVKGIVGEFEKLSVPVTDPTKGEKLSMGLGEAFLRVDVPYRNGSIKVNIYETKETN
jgi:hypothetical protein